jgi:glycosyltransferase involved in cell wall biosynthesis
MIVKNEEQVIEKTLQSAVDAVDCMYIYDTGSTDTTLERVRSFSEKYPSKKLYIKTGTFVNFEVTRNELLDWVDTDADVDFVLLLDANDEFHGCKELRAFATERLHLRSEDEGGFYIQQQWLYGQVLEKYYNVFFIRPRHAWRYTGSVHEYISPKNKAPDEALVPIRCPTTIYIYQSRNEHCDQSFIRFQRDYRLLHEDLEKDPHNPRSLFYMGQTCDCLGLHNEAFYYYARRLTCPVVGLREEVYHAHYRLGNLCIRLKKSHDDILAHYLGAYEYWNRVEPILRLCEYYLFVRKQPRLAYGYACAALLTPYPTDALLFVSDTDYSYRRYNRFMVAAFEAGDYVRAYEVGQHMKTLGILQPTDDENLKKITEKLHK